jgi:leucyl/phenylalanyl-tRNA---protein transferase
MNSAMNITPEILVHAYAQGLFPMADSREAAGLRWYDADPRGILPLETFHVPRRLARTLKAKPFTLTVNRAFDQVLRACGAREETWINADIAELYGEMHRRRLAHSVEAWDGEELAGGLYGVALGGAFFGESMFTRKTDAGKAALVHLVERLKDKGFILLDTQMVTPATAAFGAIEIKKSDYLPRLQAALERTAFFA